MAQYIPHTNPWLMDSLHKNVVITDGLYSPYDDTFSGNPTVIITNEQLEQEGFEYHRILCAEEELRFGSCCADCLKFKMHENIPTLKGKVLNVYMYCDEYVSSSDVWYVGNFIVYEDRLSADRTYREVTCYDKMYEILNTNMASWYKSLFPTSSSTITLGDMVSDFAHHFNLYFNYSTDTFANRNMVIKKTIDPVTLSGADVLRAMAELVGAFPHINSGEHYNQLYFWGLSKGIDDGLFPSDTLYPANDLYPQDVNSSTDDIAKDYYISADFEDFISESITALTIRADSEDVGVTVYSGETTPENIYTIQGNFLLYGKSTSELNAIGTALLPNLIKRYYRPATVVAKGNPDIYLSQPIRVATTYRGVTTYVLEQTYTGIQALKVTYTSHGRQFYDAQVNSITTKFQQLEGKTLKIKADIDGIETEVTDLATQTASSISQLSGDIEMKVSVGDIMDGLATETAYSAIKINPSAIQVTSSGTFTVDSTNFKLDSSGHATLKGASFESGNLSNTYAEITNDGIFRSLNSRTTTELKSGTLYLNYYDSAQKTSLFSHAQIGPGSISLYQDATGKSAIFSANLNGSLNGSAIVTNASEIETFNLHNGGVSGSHASRTPYWRKFSNVTENDYVICGA